MAQRKSPPSASPKPGGAAKPASGKPGSASKTSAARPGSASKSAPAKPGSASRVRPPATPTARPPVKKKPGRSIVNQKQTPWGLIATTALIVIFAAGIVIYAVANHKSSKPATSAYTQPEVAAAKAISGLIYKAEPDHNHVGAPVKYDTSPPIGGNHSPVWADCAGTVYPNAIANENAVHMLEHGAVWITYKPGLAAAEVATLSKLVSGVDRMAMSPYPDLKTNISLQSWDYQLFVDKASDPRIQLFISAVRYNQKTTPEYGATCSQPGFKAKPSTFGHPVFTL